MSLEKGPHLPNVPNKEWSPELKRLFKEEYEKTLDMGIFPKEVEAFFTDENSPSLVHQKDLQSTNLEYSFDQTGRKEMIQEVYAEQLSKLENSKNLPPEAVQELVKLRVDADWANQEFERYINTPQGAEALKKYTEWAEQEAARYHRTPETNTSPDHYASHTEFDTIVNSRNYSKWRLKMGINKFIHGITPKDGGRIRPPDSSYGPNIGTW